MHLNLNKDIFIRTYSKEIVTKAIFESVRFFHTTGGWWYKTEVSSGTISGSFMFQMKFRARFGSLKLLWKHWEQ